MMFTRHRSMKTKKERLEATAKDYYRCPTCGEMVDNRDRAAVRFLHEHVLHPRLDSFVTLPSGRPPAARQPNRKALGVFPIF
jgi:hypothetical protein